MERIVTIPCFHATKLNNNRVIRVYLPPDYEKETDKRYPVLYMHDGQGLFSPNPYSQQSWDIHKTADQLIRKNKIQKILIVGIDSNSSRANEFTHTIGNGRISALNGAPDIICKGELYEDFLINEVKPYIEANFRTLSNRENTALMGSSMGGLVTYNIVFRHPEIFGKAGIVSPFFERLDLNDLSDVPFCKQYDKKVPVQIWLDIGEVEANILVAHVRKMYDHFIKLGFQPGRDLAYYCVPDAAHTETDWASRIDAPLLYLFGEKGKKEKAELYGRTVIGLKGPKIQINPVVKYDSGFAESDINASFIVDNPDVLTIDPDGTIHPKNAGTTSVTYISDEIRATKSYTVIPELSEFVALNICVKVPEKTPDGTCVTVGKLCLIRLSKQEFGRSFTVPRDTAFQFTICCIDKNGNTLYENDTSHRKIVRRFKADQDMNLQYNISLWA